MYKPAATALEQINPIPQNDVSVSYYIVGPGLPFIWIIICKPSSPDSNLLRIYIYNITCVRMRVRLVVVELFPPPAVRFKAPIILGIILYTLLHDDIHTQIPIDKPRRRRLKNSMFLFVYRTMICKRI